MCLSVELFFVYMWKKCQQCMRWFTNSLWQRWLTSTRWKHNWKCLLMLSAAIFHFNNYGFSSDYSIWSGLIWIQPVKYRDFQNIAADNNANNLTGHSFYSITLYNTDLDSLNFTKKQYRSFSSSNFVQSSVHGMLHWLLKWIPCMVL